jgi:hypothetical protein
MVPNTTVNLATTKKTGKVLALGLMDAVIVVIGKTTKCTVREP